MMEFLSTITILCLIIPSFLAVIYLGVAQISIKFVLRQAGICMSFERSLNRCKAKSNKLAKRLLPIGNIKYFDLTRNPQRARAEIKFLLTEGFTLNDSYEVNLPLKADAL